MPELPDVVAYIEALQQHIVGRRLERLQPLQSVRSAVGRSADRVIVGPIVRRSDRSASASSRVCRRHRIAFSSHRFRDDLFLVLHLMIAGRLRWRRAGRRSRASGPRLLLASFEFDTARCSSPKPARRSARRCSSCAGGRGVAALDRGGIEPLDATLEQFRDALTRENHTLKRALTDPRLFSGIGNAYSGRDPARRPAVAAQADALADRRGVPAAVRAPRGPRCALWIDRLRQEAAGGFPEKVTAFRDEMAVHGRFKQPCPVCGAPVQRIVYAANECNYCAKCQTGGRLLADRSLSRLLRDDWPKLD